MYIKTIPIIIKKILILTKEVRHFICSYPKHLKFIYKPGQFITIRFKYLDKMFNRSYSISTHPIQNNIIEFSVNYIPRGIGTKFLFNLKIGDVIQILGPFGKLVLNQQTPKRYLFIATNTGISPFRSMIEDLKYRMLENKNLEIIFLQGVRTRKDILFKSDFIQFSKLFPERIKFFTYLSKELETLFYYERLGYVQKFLIDDRSNIDPKKDIIYLCGNANMISESIEILRNIGFENNNIFHEKYNISK